MMFQNWVKGQKAWEQMSGTKRENNEAQEIWNIWHLDGFAV